MASMSNESKVIKVPEDGGDRLFFESGGRRLSPWHDIPWFVDSGRGVVNMVVEIPRQSHTKMEISKEDRYNPIKQDIVNGHPRHLADIAPFHGYPCNYGTIPQTWEDPNEIDDQTGVAGDDDPLDVCEIGNAVECCGHIKEVKVLGAFAVLDEGQTDWKIVSINIDDPIATKLFDIDDVERVLPGFLQSLKDWYCQYKVPEDKDANTVALGGRLMNKQFAMALIRRCHLAWVRRKEHPLNSVSCD